MPDGAIQFAALQGIFSLVILETGPIPINRSGCLMETLHRRSRLGGFRVISELAIDQTELIKSGLIGWVELGRTLKLFRGFCELLCASQGLAQPKVELRRVGAPPHRAAKRGDRRVNFIP